MKFTNKHTLKKEINNLLINPNYSNNTDIEDWDISDITDMSFLFQNLIINKEHNKKLMGISQWNVGHVLLMNNMFDSCSSFNISLYYWDVSNVRDMSYMFNGCTNFNSNITNWDISNVRDMSYMFNGCSNFNRSLNNWDVSNVNNLSYMFSGCSIFNRSLNKWTFSTRNLSGLFNECSEFNGDITSWNVRYIEDMSSMFRGCLKFNQDISNWNVENVKYIFSMFEDCDIFNQPLDSWDVSNVEDMSSMFKECSNFNQPLDSWDVSNVTDMTSLFEGCLKFNQDISNWDVSNVTIMSSMFTYCTIFEQPLNTWNVSNVVKMNSLFSQCLNFNTPLNNWDVSNVEDMSHMFSECIMFNQSLDRWDVRKVEDMSYMFSECSIFNQPLNTWDVSNVINMNCMFKETYHFNQDLTEWDVTNVKEFNDVFIDSGISPENKPIFLREVYPKSREGINILNTLTNPNFVVGSTLIDGVQINLPTGVPPYYPDTMNDDYMRPQIEIATEYYRVSSSYHKKLTKQYTSTECFHQEVDCYVGNRLTTYFLTLHPVISNEYPEYHDPLHSEEITPMTPVVMEYRNMSIPKLKVIVKGFADFNNYLKSFPPLHPHIYSDGYYVYRGKEYQNELENLIIGQTFVIPKITSTSMDVNICKDFTTSIITKYRSGTDVVENPLGFFWRIKIPLGFPFAFIQDEEKEVCLPLGTILRYLGSHVQPAGPNSIYTNIETNTNFYHRTNTMYGALICEFEVLGISPHLLSVPRLINQIEKEYSEGNPLFLNIVNVNELLDPTHESHDTLRIRPVGPDDAFGRKRISKKNKKSKLNITNKKSKRTITNKKSKKHKK
jgi:surface protein